MALVWSCRGNWNSEQALDAFLWIWHCSWSSADAIADTTCALGNLGSAGDCVSDLPAKSSLGNSQWLSDNRTAPHGDRAQVRHCLAPDIHRRTISLGQSAGGAVLAGGTVLFPFR